MSDLANTFQAMGKVLTVCPHCDELFYLSEAHPYLSGKQTKSVVDRLRAEMRKIDRLDDYLAELESEYRSQAAMRGLKATKASLKKIDPTFSGAGHDPHDVKVIFDPITYVVFRGMSAGEVSKIILLDNAASNARTERLHKSIHQTIKNGNLEFRTLRVAEDGQVTSE